MKAKYIVPATEIIRLNLRDGILEENDTASVPVIQKPGGVDIWDAEGNNYTLFDEEEGSTEHQLPAFELWK